MTPEGRKVWGSEAGIELLRCWLYRKPLTAQAKFALAQLHGLNRKQSRNEAMGQQEVLRIIVQNDDW